MSGSEQEDLDLLRYKWSGWKRAVVCEVMIPKKIQYYSKLQEVLEALFDKEKINAAPAMKVLKVGATIHNSPDLIDPDRLVTMFGGYSIYEADGRFVNKAGKAIDERVLIIRIIFNVEDSDSKTFMEAVRFYVSYRLAVELGSEDEIWTVVHDAAHVGIFKDTAQTR
jgi:hypothetical protein